MSRELTLQAAFDEAVQSLAQKNYSDAIEKLEAIRKTGYSSSDVEGNLGLAYVGKGQLGQGIAHLEKAIALDRFDFQSRRDLNLAQSKVENGWGNTLSNPLDLGNHLASFIRPQESLALASIFVLLALFGRLFKYLKQKGLATMLGLASVFLIMAIYSFLSRGTAVVVVDTELKSAPIESAETTNPLKSGTRVRILRSSGGYAEVERANAFRGWVLENSLETSPY